jgi:hypothetical protein
MPRPPGAPPGIGKLGGLFKRRKKDEEFIADDSADDAPAPAADGSDAAAATAATAEAPPEPAPPPPLSYETWKWPSIEAQKPKSKVPMIALIVIVLLVLAGAAFGAYKLLHKDKKATPARKTTTAAAVAKKPPPAPAKGGEKAFATSIESILAQSVAQRGKLVQVLAATENGCSVPVAKAKEQVAAVASGRESLLAKTKALPAPTPQAKTIRGLLAKALASSLAANRHYTAWVGGLAGASPCPGSTASNTDFKAAGAASVQASAAKQAFTKAFNPLASRLGQKTWSPDAI